MDLNALGDFISRVGFPVAIALLLFWKSWKQESHTQALLVKNQADEKKTQETLVEQTSALSALADAIERLCLKESIPIIKVV
jgi:hypothetical protein